MGNYDDIIHLPHYCSRKRSHMSRQDRAAQFSPFAALTGFDAAIEETGRLTDDRPELTEYRNTQLDQMLNCLMEQLPCRPMVAVTFFLQDTRKSGGSKERKKGYLQKIDLYNKNLAFTDGDTIALEDILHIECPEVAEL